MTTIKTVFSAFAGLVALLASQLALAADVASPAAEVAGQLARGHHVHHLRRDHPGHHVLGGDAD